LKFSKFCLIFILFAIWTSCSNDIKKPKELILIAELGQENINKKELDIYAQILALNASSQQVNSAALYKLSKTILIDSVAKKHQFILKDTLLTLESDRIDNNTLLPENITSIKGICSDTETYRNVYIKTNLYPRWLHEQFKWEQKLHTEAGNLAKEIFSDVSKQPILFSKNSLRGFPIEDFHLSEVGLKLIETNPDNRANKDKSKFIDQTKEGNLNVKNHIDDQIKQQADLITNHYLTAIKGLNDGTFHPQPLQTAEDFKILQFVRQEGALSRIKILTIPKRSYHDWLEKEIKNISLTIHDKQAWNQMLIDIPESKNQFTYSIE